MVATSLVLTLKEAQGYIRESPCEKQEKSHVTILFII